ncbi:MAG: butyrate kinase [Bacteroidetes bacterium]|nr:MAG: butyrate kinase [Bacteroidota bacterium]
MSTCTNHTLVINPGSTSTKIAVYFGLQSMFHKNIVHTEEELEQFEKVADQFQFRKDVILNELHQNDVDIMCIEIVMGRGGLIKPVPSGVIAVNERLKEDLRNSPMGEHASNLGGLIADDIAQSLPNAKAYIADPVVVDEFEDIARVSGHPLLVRKSIFHALNQKAIAYEYSHAISTPYEDLSLIVAHMGGGITVGAHRNGRVIDVNQGLDGDGPFSPERAGSLPVGDLVGLCFSGKYTEKEIRKMITGKGGLVAYFNSNDARKIENLARENDEKAILIYQAMAYQVAKEIGAMIAVLHSKVDAILLTGGMAYSNFFVQMISERVSNLAPVHVYPGEDEMKALAKNAVKIFKGEVEPMIYE